MPIIPKPGDPLTDRELEVLRLVAFGQSNRRIANALATAEDTIKTHLRHVFCKLGARDRAHAVALAQQTGALAMPPGSTPRLLPTAAARPGAGATSC